MCTDCGVIPTRMVALMRAQFMSVAFSVTARAVHSTCTSGVNSVMPNTASCGDTDIILRSSPRPSFWPITGCAECTSNTRVEGSSRSTQALRSIGEAVSGTACNADCAVARCGRAKMMAIRSRFMGEPPPSKGPVQVGRLKRRLQV